MNEPSVSVCIPTYNGERYLRECLESILLQTRRDFEVLIVDDCSSDGTMNICVEYASQDPRFRIERNPRNLGLVSNWARCIDLARADWVKFVFQDDLIDPGCVEQLIREGERSGCPLVFCRRRYLFEGGTPKALQEYYLNHRHLTAERFTARGVVGPEDLARMILASPTPDTNFIGEPTSVLFRKSLLRQFGGFNPMLAVSCDTEFWQRLGVNVGVAHVSAELATFRVHRGATTSMHLREKQFRMNVLDPVLVLHEQAFHPAFEPLRRVAQRVGKNLESMFYEKAAWAFNSARAMASEAGGRNSAPLEDWGTLAATMPRLAGIESSSTARPSLVRRAASKTRRLLAGS